MQVWHLRDQANCRGRQAATSDLAKVLGAGMGKLRRLVYKKKLPPRTGLRITA